MADKWVPDRIRSSTDFADVGEEFDLYSGAHLFDFPQIPVPQEPDEGDGTEDSHAAFFLGSANRRNQGRRG